MKRSIYSYLLLIPFYGPFVCYFLVYLNLEKYENLSLRIFIVEMIKLTFPGIILIVIAGTTLRHFNIFNAEIFFLVVITLLWLEFLIMFIIFRFKWKLC